jgi:uncharacterized protein
MNFKFGLVLFALALLGIGAALAAGHFASSAAPSVVGPPPADLAAEAVSFASLSGSQISGWFLEGQPRRGAVMLMHGIRANRLEMLERARLLNRHGFAVLLFDFQAHGQSPGRNITFGFLEARDARAAFDWLRQRMPGERVGVLGMSLGGAAAVVGETPLEADAMVLEAVFGSFEEALRNRLKMYLGPLGFLLAPLLKALVRPRLGFDPEVLNPARAMARVRCPVLLIAGEKDIHARLSEMTRLYEIAHEPKELWVIENAAHVDFHRFARVDYERHVLGFFGARLSR